MRLVIEDLPENEDYTVEEHILNRRIGSAFDTWLQFGGQPIGEELALIKARSRF